MEGLLRHLQGGQFMTRIKRDYKSRMFTMIFSDKKELLELYNAVAKRNYQDPELLTINTLENAIYMSMKNDLSFLIDCRVPIYEQQSTYNPNMPLRCLFYSSDMYSAITAGQNLYGTKLIQIPAPRFVVFYNGEEKRPEREILKLSDSFMVKEEEVSMELIVEVLNINVGYNEELKKACKTLSDYSTYVQRVRDYRKSRYSIEDAVEQTISDCIRDDILKEFLMKNRAEAKAVSIYEYNEEEHMKMEREQHYEDGLKEGLGRGEIRGAVKTYRKLKFSDEEIVKQIMEDFNLQEEEAKEYCK